MDACVLFHRIKLVQYPPYYERALNEASLAVACECLGISTDGIRLVSWPVEAACWLAQALIEGNKVESLGLEEFDHLLRQWDNARVGASLGAGSEISSRVPHIVVERHKVGCTWGCRANLLLELVEHVGDLGGGSISMNVGVPVDRIQVP